MVITLQDCQKRHYRMVINRLNKYSSCLDTSPLGSGKTYISFIISKMYSKVVVISTPIILSKWKDLRKQDPVENEMYFFSFGTAGKKINTIRHLFSEDKTLVVIDEVHNYKNESNRTKNYLEAIEKVNKTYYHTLCISSTPIDKNKHLVNILRVMGLYRGDICVQQGMTWFYPGYTSFARNCNAIFKTNLDMDISSSSRATSIISEEGKKIIKTKLLVNEPGQENKSSLTVENRVEKSQENFDFFRAIQALRTLRYSERTKISNITNVMTLLEFTKLKYYKEIIAENIRNNPTKKFVVMCNYNFTMFYLKEYLEDVLGIQVETVPGSCSIKAKKLKIDTFQEDNLNSRVLIGNIKVLSTGIDLDDKYGQFSRHAFIFPSYHAIDIKQASSRFHRLDTKSDSKVEILYIEYQNEGEIKLVEALRQKFNVIKDMTSTFEEEQV